MWRIPAVNAEFTGRDQIRAGVKRLKEELWDYLVQTTHPGTIALDGDTATGRAYVLTFGRRRDGGSALCDELADNRATAVLLLVGYPEPAVSIVKSVRRDQRLAQIMIGAPAGQPEFAGWPALLGDDSAAIPFLRYLPQRLSPLGARVETALRERLAQTPSFVAFEGYDTVAVLAGMLRGRSSSPARQASASGNGPGRPSKSQIEIRRNRTASGYSTSREGTRTRLLIRTYLWWIVKVLFTRS